MNPKVASIVQKSFLDNILLFSNLPLYRTYTVLPNNVEYVKCTTLVLELLLLVLVSSKEQIHSFVVKIEESFKYSKLLIHTNLLEDFQFQILRVRASFLFIFSNSTRRAAPLAGPKPNEVVYFKVNKASGTRV